MTRRGAIAITILAALLGLATTVGVAWVFACMSIETTGRTSAQRILPERGHVTWEPMGGPQNGLNVDVYEDRGRVFVRARAHGPDFPRVLGTPLALGLRAVEDPPDAIVPRCIRALALPWLFGTPWPRGSDRDWCEVEASGWPMLALSAEHQRAPDFSYRHYFAINIGGTRNTGGFWRSTGSPRLLPLRPLWPGFLVDTLLFGALWWFALLIPFILRSRRR